MTNKLRIFEVIKESWNKISGSKLTFWQVLIIVLAIEYGFIFIDRLSTAAVMPKWGILSIYLAKIIIQSILSWSLIYLGIQKTIGVQIHFRLINYVFSWDLLKKMLGLYILKILILLLPLLLIFLPSSFAMSSEMTTNNVNNNLNILNILIALSYLAGMILVLFLIFRLYIASAIVIANKMNPWAAIKISFKATQSNVWRLIGLTIVNTAIVMISIIPLGIGLIWSIPYLFINYGIVYQKLYRGQVSP